MDYNKKVEVLERKISYHILYEYPQIDERTRVLLSNELALILVGEFE